MQSNSVDEISGHDKPEGAKHPAPGRSPLVNSHATGICIGASTVSMVSVTAGSDGFIHIQTKNTKNADGNPKQTLLGLLASMKSGETPLVVTGRKLRERVRLTTISESEATETALELFHDDAQPFSALASLGAETFVVYDLDGNGKSRRLISKNQCASGTGEFYVQQTGRMNLTIEDAVAISAGAEPYKVSGRCSVFCKSDCTHALNKGVPKENVAAGLALMIAEKAAELLGKARQGKIMVVGGVTQNTTVMDFLRKKFPHFYIPAEASYFEALGAAVYGLYNYVSVYKHETDVFIEGGSLFGFHPPLQKFLKDVDFHASPDLSVDAAGDCILGLDVGSTTTKGVIIRNDNQAILASEYLYTHGNPIEAARKVYRSLQAQVPADIRITGLGVTGSGRHITALHAGTDSIINEITAHASAAVFFDPEVDTIFEIGGQDAKYTFINNGVPADYAMNEACSAGTGSFIQEAAGESLRVKLEDIQVAAFRAQEPLNFRDQCAALIGSDIKTALQENFSRDDILAGLVYSICINYINRVKGNRPVGKKIFMQGGVCYNKAIPVAMAAITGRSIIVPPDPGLMGAFGTALKVKEAIDKGLTKKSVFDLQTLLDKAFSAGKSFICKDRTNGCDRNCEINTFRIDGKIFPFGGACNKYYNGQRISAAESHEKDFVKRRMQRIFRTPAGALKHEKTIGLNLSFTINRLFPLYRTFFDALGYRVILPDKVDEAALENQQSSFCFPVELAHGLFGNLLEKKPGFIFMPEIYEMLVRGHEGDPKDSNATCVFVSKEANYLSQAFRHVIDENRLIHPYLNFAKGYDSQKEVFLEVGKRINAGGRQKILQAYAMAVRAQEAADHELKDLGASVLRDLEAHPDEHAIVLVGRDYNAFSELANKGIPGKLATLGFRVIPYDIIDGSAETVPVFQSWESGKRILKVARIISRHPQLFGVYISNYSCGPDSFLVPHFRNIMGNKPSLTLELDQHTADAGINTRIDAFLDVVENYKRLNTSRGPGANGRFKAATISNQNGSGSMFIDSSGEQLNLLDPRVKIVIPCIGDTASALFAGSLRSLGYNAVALPETDGEVFETGRRHTSGKECLPIILLAGSLINYIEKQRKPGEKVAFFNIGGTSACRIAQYPVFLENLVQAHQMPDVAMLTLISQEGYLGLTKGFLKHSIEAIIINDVLEEVRSGILANAEDPEKGLEVFYDEFEKLVQTFSADYQHLFDALKLFSRNIADKVPCRIPVTESKYIALTGEIFIRHNQFAHKKLNHYFGRHGFILKDAYIAEWIKYLDYAWRKGVDRPDFSFRQVLDRLLREQYITLVEKRVQKILETTNYLQPSKTRVVNLIRHSLHVLPLESTGEPALTLGTALAEGYEKYCGIINIGPFGCLQTRIGEAVCMPNMDLGTKKQVKENLHRSYKIPPHLGPDTTIPFLTIECDGKGFPQIIESRLENFLVQSQRAAENMKQKV